MRRVMVLLLVQALIATAGAVPLLHTHAYDDHDHPEHHHGLAAHQHHALSAEADDRSTHMEGCDPGKHTLSYAFVCAAASQVQAGDAEFTRPAAPGPEIQFERTVRRPDARAHGPPPRTQSSPRAPPLIALA